MLKIKMVGGFAAMVCVLAAFAAPSFAFTEFTGTQGKVVKSSEQVFTAGGVLVKCASVTGTAGKESKEQVKTTAINYEKCIIGKTAATVSGCQYNFHINGTVSLVGKACVVKAGTECELRIEETGNLNLSKLTYTSLGTEKSELKSEVAGITFKGFLGICAGLSGSTATYKGSIGVEGIGVV